MTSRVASFVRLAIMLGAAAPLAATAAAAATDDGLLEEIVVTAQKREESLRDVPLSVEAVSGDKLADAGIVRLDDLKAYVPNLQMTETGIANNIYIRGIGSGLNQGFEQSVSLYQDGIYRGRGHQSRMPFLDLARVEVLRGPQPILFGKNAVAGAVNMVAARPTRDFEGSIRGSRDFENDETVASTDALRPAQRLLRRRASPFITAMPTATSAMPRWAATSPCATNCGARFTLDVDATDNFDLSLARREGQLQRARPPDRDLRRNAHRHRRAHRPALQPDHGRPLPDLRPGPERQRRATTSSTTRARPMATAATLDTSRRR